MKKWMLGVLCAVTITGLACVYAIGGMAGAYAWSFFVLVAAPTAMIAAIAQLVVLVVRLCKRKPYRWNVLFLAFSLMLAYPVTILLGLSPVTYPAMAPIADGIEATLPVKDAVLMGGKDYKTHAVWPSERYAYDILVEPYDIGSSALESYGIYNAEVIAPVSGTVIGMENNEPDITPNTEEFTSQLGNYLFIKIDSTETYLILAHFKQGSITVSLGEQLTEGIPIGRVGNSGTTSEPHLHIQHQRNNPLAMLYPTCAEGLPITFG